MVGSARDFSGKSFGIDISGALTRTCRIKNSLIPLFILLKDVYQAIKMHAIWEHLPSYHISFDDYVFLMENPNLQRLFCCVMVLKDSVGRLKKTAHL